MLYVAWNLWWLGQARIPPSIFTFLTGIPCPTTGGVRALRAALTGDWAGSLRHHALLAPLAAMFALSAAWPLGQWLSGRRVHLPAGFLWAWIVALGAAWAVKIVTWGLGFPV